MSVSTTEAGSSFLDHRPRLAKAAKILLWGDHPGKVSHHRVCRLFLRCLGGVYLIAFVSFWIQMEGLIGNNGLMPAEEFLGLVHDRYGSESYRLLPSLVWLHPKMITLHLICMGGVVCSVLALLYRGVGPSFFLLWAGYLSLSGPAQTFLGYQWDSFLVEVGFLAIFMAPWRWKPKPQAGAPITILWLYRWLLFRLMFSSGAVKLLSGDSTWSGLTALDYHYETQPLPTWLAWYMHQLPVWFHKTSTVLMFVIELVLPFLIFLPRRPRLVAFWGFVLLQVLILLTGNYTFFNWLTLVLCIPLLDDAALAAMLPKKWFAPREMRYIASPWGEIFRPCLACVIVLTGALQLTIMFRRSLELPKPIQSYYRTVGAFRTVNHYGLFAVMTTDRPEIIIEGSLDGENWEAYGFKWKPGDLDARPRFVAPHQPRLDWQMWFAALGDYRRNPWLLRFMEHLTEGTPEVLALIGHNPFPGKPPIYVRAVLYEYRFTDWRTKKETSHWWTRERKGLYAPVVGPR